MANTSLEYTLRLKDFFRKTMLGAAKDTEKLDSNMNKLGRTASRVGASIAGYFAVSNVANFARAVVLSTAAMTSFNNAIVASSRSGGEGQTNIAFLNDQVDRLGLNLDAAKSGYKTFTGAVMGTNIQGAKSNKIFRQVSEAATVLGLSAEQTEGSFLALGQMMSKGTVQAEELRGQLAERIPGAFQIGARAMGMTTKQLGENMQKGLINSSEFLTKFGDELERTFGGKLGAATQSVQANINRMDTEWERMKVNIGNSQTGLINTTLNWASNTLKYLNVVLSKTNELEQAFAKFGGRDFSWIEKLTPLLTPGVSNNFTNTLGAQSFYQKEFVDKSALGEKEGLKAKGDLEKLLLSYTKDFKSEKIGSEFYLRQVSIIGSALEKVNGNLKSNDTTGASTPLGTAAGKTGPMGTGVDVSGPRAQNVTINVEYLVKDQNIHTETFKEGLQQAKAMTSKEFLELLNDANQIANR